MIRAFLFLIVGAVLANAQCYSACLMTPSGGVCKDQHAGVACPGNVTKFSRPHVAANASIAFVAPPRNFSVEELTTNAVPIQETSCTGIPPSPHVTVLRI